MNRDDLRRAARAEDDLERAESQLEWFNAATLKVVGVSLARSESPMSDPFVFTRGGGAPRCSLRVE